MARFIDASVLITLERRGYEAEDVTSLIPGEELAIASITASELLVGVHLADTPERSELRRAFIETVFEMLPVIPFDLLTARVHSLVAAEMQVSKQSVGANDMIVAATALAYQSGVVTENVREFRRIPGLSVEHPGW